MPDGALHLLPITSLAAGLARGRVTAVQAVEACLSVIESRERDIHAFVRVDADAAREAAKLADAEIASGNYRGPLHGVPLSVKDLIDIAGLPTTAASRSRIQHMATEDAVVIRRLRRTGAVLLGKCNLHEFAFGTTGEDSAFGVTRNPFDLDRSAGGSSGGSAAAVATGMSYGSIGTDTGGSVRIPAAACGVVGLKPGYGELPSEGVVPLSASLDHVGPLARTVDDVSLLFAAIAGRSNAAIEPSSVPRVRDVRLGLLRGYFFELLDGGVRTAFDEALSRLRDAGCQIDEVEITDADFTPATYLHIILPEASTVHDAMLRERPDDYSAPVRLRLEMGRYVLAEDYLRAQAGRRHLRATVNRALSDCTALVLPTLPIPAPPLGVADMTVDGTSESVRSLTLRLTQLFNLTGHPAISLPSGRVGALPCGLQLVGHIGATPDLLSVARACEPLVSGR